MKDQKRTGIRLFLIEFLIVLFFFFLVSAVCLKLFAAAHQTTAQAEALSYAQTLAASTIELLEASPESLMSGQTIQYYDPEFAPCTEESAAYVLTAATETLPIQSPVSTPASAFFVTMTVSQADGTVVYTLSTTLHRPIRYENLSLSCE